jgi:PAS domain S-box-containing protein
MNVPLRIIVVESPREDVELILVELCRGGYEVTCERVSTATDMTAALSEMKWDIVIANYNALVFCPFAALKLLQESGFDLPLIILSDRLDEDTAVRAMKAGARDYILKNDLKRVLPVIERELRESEARRKRKQAEYTLRQSEELFRQLVENSDHVFWINSINDNKTLYISPGYEKIWGRTCQSLYEQPTTWLDAIHPDDRNRIENVVIAHWLQWVQQGLGTYDEEFRIIRPDGSVRWIRDRAFPIKDASGQIYRVAGIAEDITERKLAEHVLHESEGRFRNLIASSPVGIFENDTTGRCLYVNERAAELVGLSVNECLDFGWTRALFEADRNRVQECWREALRAGYSFREEYRFQHADRAVAWVIGQVVGVTNTEGRHTGFICTLTDITERKRAEEALREAEARLRIALEKRTGI